MKKTRTKIVAGMALLAGTIVVTGIVWAKATSIPVSSHIRIVPDYLTAKIWVDDGGVTHIRHLHVEYFNIDDNSPAGWGIVNINIDQWGNGDEAGWGTFPMTLGDLSGTFEGRFRSTITNRVTDGHGVYHGSEDFEGMKMMVDIEALGAEMTARSWGILLDPHGRIGE